MTTAISAGLIAGSPFRAQLQTLRSAAPSSLILSRSRLQLLYHSSTTVTVQNGRRPRLTLFTGPQCSLCDDAKVEINSASKDAPAELEMYNIRNDSLPDVHKWRRAYQYDIPVLHLEGKEIMRHRVDRSKLVEAIRRAQRQLDTVQDTGAR